MGEVLKLLDNFFAIILKDDLNPLKIDPQMNLVMTRIYDFTRTVIEEYKQNDTEIDFGEDCAGKIEVCQNELQKIIEILKSTGESREEFMRKFPVWKTNREQSINHLDKIAETLHNERKLISALKIIGCVAGVAGGAAILASIFCPPAGVVAALPAWLGGARVAALLPSFLRRAAVPATSMWAIRGGAASAVSGASQLTAAIAEIILLKKRIDEAKSVISTDKEQFRVMEKWFTHTKKFNEALQSVIDISILDIVLKDLCEFLDEIRKMLHSKMYRDFDAKLRLFFGKIQYQIKITEVQSPRVVIAFIGILLLIFLIYRQNRILLGCLLFTTNTVLAHNAIKAGISGAQSFAAMSTKGAIAGVKRTPKVLLRDITLGAFAGFGIALNTAFLVLNAIDLSKGSVCEEGNKIKSFSNALKDELEVFEDVYKNLQDSIINDLFWSSQNV